MELKKFNKISFKENDKLVKYVKNLLNEKGFYINQYNQYGETILEVFK